MQSDKKVLITGMNSFLGRSLEDYLARYTDTKSDNRSEQKYQIHTVDVKGTRWESFSGYQAVYHVAGIAHSTGVPEIDYKRINTDLAVRAAKRAKASGVKQFIFMSTSLVYGDLAEKNAKTTITRETLPCPNTPYGKSKLEAEEKLQKLADDSFKVCIIRSPMVYGEGCKGNYPRLRKLALKTPVFPKIHNQRSMIYVENLMEFIRLLIDNEESGVFWPQNTEYVNTSDLVRQIATAHGKKVRIVRGFDWLISIGGVFSKSVRKAAGSTTYDKSMSEYKEVYNIYDFGETIKRTEGMVGEA